MAILVSLKTVLMKVKLNLSRKVENSENSADEASNFVNDQELEVNLIPLNDQEAHYLGVPKLEQIVLKQLLLIEEAQAGVGVTYLLCHLWK